MNAPHVACPLFNVTVSACPLPNYLIPKVARTEHRVHHQFQVVTRGGVAVKIYAASWL